MLTIPGIIPIRIHPFFWVLAFLIGYSATAQLSLMFIWVGVIVASVLVHEFGHALTAIAFGQRAHIDLVALGGITQRYGPHLTLWQEFLVILNGPLAGLALYFLARTVFLSINVEHNQVLAYTLFVATQVNLVWTIFNLVPIQPLDGGRLLSIVLESLFGLKGVKAALFFSMILAGLLSGLAFYFNELFIGAILMMFMFESYRNWRGSLVVTEKDQDTSLQFQFKEAEHDYYRGQWDAALEQFRKVRDSAKAGVLFITASQYMAEILSKQNKLREALNILLPLEKKLTPNALRLLHQLAYNNGEWERAIDIGKRSYQVQPSYDTALTNAFAHAQLEQVRPAVGWLQCAIREGLPNLSEIIQSHEFDTIRHDPLFQTVSPKR